MTHVDRAIRMTLLATVGTAFGWAASAGTARGAGPAASQPASQPAGDAAKPEEKPPEDEFLRRRRQQRDVAGNAQAGLRDLGTMTRETLVQLWLEDGKLRADATPLAAPQSARVTVEGSGAVWSVSRQPAPAGVFGPAALQGPTIMVQRLDRGVQGDDEFWSAYLSGNNNYLSLTGQSVRRTVSYSQSGNVISVSVSEWGGGPRPKTVFTARAPTLQQLRSDHPEEFRRYVVPLLSRLSDPAWLRPGAADVYNAFADLPADPEAVRQVEALLAGLEAPAAADRDAASARLDALGPAGVLAILRLDPNLLSAEQRARLARYVARHRRRTFADPAAAQRDPNFLADALEYDDPAVRAAAAHALERVLGQPVPFDVTLAGDALTTAVDEVRKQIAQLAPATQPATKPAAAAADGPRN